MRYGEGYRGQTVDIFNIGHILFTMLTQRFPLGDAHKGDDFYKYIINDLPDVYWSKFERNPHFPKLSTSVK